MNAFKTAPRPATRDRVREAFSHLVISQQVLDQLGPAVNAATRCSSTARPGNGKTVISQAIRNLLDGEIAIPHAIEVEGAIIRFFDPGQPRADRRRTISTKSARSRAATCDRRWVRCRRPMVMVGGELTLDALELSYSPTTASTARRCRRSPTAACSSSTTSAASSVAPRDLLNRWIVPLESRVDFLTLQTGQKFDLPFMVLVVFATNIKPADLVDEAFLRRIHYKVFAESPTVAEFMQIFENCCSERGLTFDRDAGRRSCCRTITEPRKIPLRGCQPRDLIDQVLSLAEYRGEPPRADDGAARSGLRRLLRRRARGDGSIRLSQ